MSISGPAAVCPGQTYTYTLHNAGPGESLFFLNVNGSPVNMSNNSIGSSNTFSIPYGAAVGNGIITVKTYFPNKDNGFVNETSTFNVNIRLITPDPPRSNDGYVIIGCSSGEQVPVFSSPAPTNNAENCYYHCNPSWSAPGGWNLTNDDASGNPLADFSTFTNAKLIFPSGLSTGNQGQLMVTAQYVLCGHSQNTSSSSSIWYGTPNIRDPYVNGSPSQSFNVVNGSAYLSIQSDAATSYTWTIVGGSGYIYPGTNSCNVSVNGFIRVEARANNRCGNGASYTFYLSSGSGYRVSPNPTTSQVRIDFDSKELVNDALTSISLLNDRGKILKGVDVAKAKKDRQFNDTNTFKFDVNDLPRGTYFLHVSYGDKVLTSQVVLE